jgi:hypothetical protein
MKFIRAGQERIAKTVKEIPYLVIKDEVFADSDSNNVINANEKSEIRFKIENLGIGSSGNVLVKVSLKNEYIRGLDFTKEISVGHVLPSESKMVIIPITGKMDLADTLAEFKIDVREENGFDAFPLEMKIETHSFQPPDLIVADGVFSTPDGGKLELNQFINLNSLCRISGKAWDNR